MVLVYVIRSLLCSVEESLINTPSSVLKIELEFLSMRCVNYVDGSRSAFALCLFRL